MNQQANSPLKLSETISEYWTPKVIDQLDDYFVKLAKLKGALTWHTHQDQDELFLVLQGSLTMEYSDKKVHLKQGDLHVVPKGAKHNPVAHQECIVMLIEHQNTLHTGDVIIPESRSIEQQLSSYLEN